jgi:toxin FitB
MYLVDTNVVSELLQREPDAGVRRWANLHAGDAGLSTVAIFELRLGAMLLPEGRRRDELLGTIERAIARFGPRIYAFDRASAEMASEINGLSTHRGRPMSRMDAQIAGIAAVYGLTLITRNVADFEATGLDVINPWES